MSSRRSTSGSFSSASSALSQTGSRSSMTHSRFTLYLRVHSAEKMQLSSSQSSYCKMYLGESAVVNATHTMVKTLFGDAANNGQPPHRTFHTKTTQSKHPSMALWNEKFEVAIDSPEALVLSIRVKNQMALYSPSVGACAIYLKQLRVGQSIDQSFPLHKGSSPVGSIRLQLMLADTNGSNKDLEKKRAKEKLNEQERLKKQQQALAEEEELRRREERKRAKEREEAEQKRQQRELEEARTQQQQMATLKAQQDRVGLQTAHRGDNQAINSRTDLDADDESEASQQPRRSGSEKSKKTSKNRSDDRASSHSRSRGDSNQELTFEDQLKSVVRDALPSDSDESSVEGIQSDTDDEAELVRQMAMLKMKMKMKKMKAKIKAVKEKKKRSKKKSGARDAESASEGVDSSSSSSSSSSESGSDRRHKSRKSLSKKNTQGKKAKKKQASPDQRGSLADKKYSKASMATTVVSDDSDSNSSDGGQQPSISSMTPDEIVEHKKSFSGTSSFSLGEVVGAAATIYGLVSGDSGDIGVAPDEPGMVDTLAGVAQAAPSLIDAMTGLAPVGQLLGQSFQKMTARTVQGRQNQPGTAPFDYNAVYDAALKKNQDQFAEIQARANTSVGLNGQGSQRPHPTAPFDYNAVYEAAFKQNQDQFAQMQAQMNASMGLNAQSQSTTPFDYNSAYQAALQQQQAQYAQIQETVNASLAQFNGIYTNQAASNEQGSQSSGTFVPGMYDSNARQGMQYDTDPNTSALQEDASATFYI